MDIEELSNRVTYAEVLHGHRPLSQWIQRRLKARRSREIAEYLKEQPERLFNSLIVATYEGRPRWCPLERVRPTLDGSDVADPNPHTVRSVGFLTLRGDERLFALDGQHRLAGIKRAVAEGLPRARRDEISVIFVAHSNTVRGLQRSRRLFTTLNKTAKPVSKSDIITLDEDDVMAICVRRLIEESPLFGGVRVALVASTNMPTSNVESLTTIGNLYDILTISVHKVPVQP